MIFNIKKCVTPHRLFTCLCPVKFYSSLRRLTTSRCEKGRRKKVFLKRRIFLLNNAFNIHKDVFASKIFSKHALERL